MAMTFDKLPRSWQSEIRHLRRSCARYRVQVKELEAELALLKAGSDVRAT
jgi:hypothetical protein